MARSRFISFFGRIKRRTAHAEDDTPSLQETPFSLDLALLRIAIMRVTPSLLAFVFLSVVAAGIIPEIAVRDSIVGGGSGSGILSIGRFEHPISGLSNAPSPSPTIPLESTGKYSRLATLRIIRLTFFIQTSLPVALTMA